MSGSEMLSATTETASNLCCHTSAAKVVATALIVCRQYHPEDLPR